MIRKALLSFVLLLSFGGILHAEESQKEEIMLIIITPKGPAFRQIEPRGLPPRTEFCTISMYDKTNGVCMVKGPEVILDGGGSFGFVMVPIPTDFENLDLFPGFDENNIQPLKRAKPEVYI